YALYGATSTFYYLLALRLSVGALLLLVYPVTAQSRPLGQTDAVIFGLQIVMIAAFSLGMFVIPHAFLVERVSVQSVTALMLLIAQSLFIANRLQYVTVAGLTCSVLYLGVTIAIERINPSALALEAGVHAVANLLGVITVWRTGLMRRRQFA